MSSESVIKKLIDGLHAAPQQGLKPDKINGEYNFFITGTGRPNERASTKIETKAEKKGALNTEQSISFFLPEWF
jgi:hypothetical protein